MSEDLTSLQLAERIAMAVLAADEDFVRAVFNNKAHVALAMESGAQAVLRTLLETGHVICRVTQDEDGVIDGTVAKVRLPFEAE
jgi:hypothetical protein